MNDRDLKKARPKKKVYQKSAYLHAAGQRKLKSSGILHFNSYETEENRQTKKKKNKRKQT